MTWGELLDLAKANGVYRQDEIMRIHILQSDLPVDLHITRVVTINATDGKLCTTLKIDG